MTDTLLCAVTGNTIDTRNDSGDYVGPVYISGAALADNTEEELVARWFHNIGCSADWINDAFKVTENMVIFDDTDYSGNWQIITHVIDGNETRHSDIHFDGDLLECLAMALQAQHIGFNCETAGNMSPMLEEICVSNSLRTVQRLGLEVIEEEVKALNVELNQWCAENYDGVRESAEEMLFQIEQDTGGDHRSPWLREFIVRWNAATRVK